MATTKKKQNDTTIRLGDLPEELTARGRDIWLAGLGAVAAVEEEGTRLFNALVNRGEQFEQRGRKQLQAAADGIDAQQKQAVRNVEDTVGRVEDIVTRTTKTVLDRFDVPTRKEVKNLAQRVEALTKKIDALAGALDKRAAKAAATADADRPVYVVVPREEGWAVEKEGAERATSLHDTKKEALEAARGLARDKAPSTLLVHKQDGTVQETLTYEGDE